MGVYLYVVKKIILIEKDEVALPTKGYYVKQMINEFNIATTMMMLVKFPRRAKNGQTARLLLVDC